MRLKPGKLTYPLPSTWTADQRCVMRTARNNLELLPINLAELDLLKCFNAVPTLYAVDQDKRTVSFWPAPAAAYEVEFVEAE